MNRTVADDVLRGMIENEKKTDLDPDLFFDRKQQKSYQVLLLV